MITGRGDLWVSTERAFSEPLNGALIVWKGYSQTHSYVPPPGPPVVQTEPTLYARRNLIEQGFQGMQTVC